MWHPSRLFFFWTGSPVLCVYGCIRFRMASAHSSISHFGVDVAPQMPTERQSSNQAKSISDAASTRYERGFTLRHSSYRTFPLELFLPHTKRITSWRVAKSRMCGMRLATWRQMVS